MDDTREVHVEHVEHVPDDPEEHVIDTAAAAVALAEGTAAAAELQAAQLVEQVERSADEWRTSLENRTAEHGAILASLSENVAALRSLEEGRHTRDDELRARMTALEERLPTNPANPSPSNPRHSNGEIAEAGAETEAKLGPAEASLGGETSLDNPIAAKAESENSPPKRRHRWI